MMAHRRAKKTNIANIIREIWLNGRISRVDIARNLGLDKSTVTNLVSDLVESGFVREREEGESSPQGGRRPIFLELDRDYGCILGVEIQAEGLSVVAVNLAGDIIKTWKELVEISSGDLIDKTEDRCRRCIDDLQQMGRRPLGVGLGLGGLVNPEQGYVNYSVPLEIYKPFSVATPLASRLELPVYLENDANACSWGELAFHKNSAPRNFMFVLVEFRERMKHIMEIGGVGVGLGIVLDGKVYHGAGYSAGEFRSSLCEGEGKSQFSIDPVRLSRITQDVEVLRLFTEELASNIALFVNSLNLNHVFLGGDIENYTHLIDVQGPIRKAVYQNWMYPFEIDFTVQLSSFGSLAVSYGAAGFVLSRLVDEASLGPGQVLQGGRSAAGRQREYLKRRA